MLNLTQFLSFSSPSTKIERPPLRYGENRLPVVVWNITNSCNLNCSFCYYDAKRRDRGDCISHALAERIVRQLKRTKIKYLLLSGGEPLLYPKILDLLKDLTSSSIRVGISTNGTLIDKKIAAALKRSGVDYVGISLDGPKRIHDRLRNSLGAFDQAMSGLRHVQNAGLKTGIRLTLTIHNHLYLEDFFSLVERLKVDRLCFYHLVYSGRANFDKNDLSRIERRKAVETIIELTDDWIKRKIKTHVLTVDNFSDAAILLDYIRKTKPSNSYSAIELLHRQGGCPAGNKILSIDHEGYLHPCQFWHNERLADLKREELSDIMEDRESFDYSWKSKLKGRCAVCKFQDICAGCRVRAYHAYRDFFEEDPSCCLEESEIRDEACIMERN